MGGDKAGASQGFAVIRLGVGALGAGRVGEERSGWVAGEASPAGFGSWGEVVGGVQEGGRAGTKPRCSEVCRPVAGPAPHVCRREWHGFRLRAEAVGQAASLGGARCECLWRCPALPTPRRLSSQPALPHRTLLTGQAQPLAAPPSPGPRPGCQGPDRLRVPLSRGRSLWLETGGKPFGFCQ